MGDLPECEETMTTQQESYEIICTIKNIINSLI